MRTLFRNLITATAATAAVLLFTAAASATPLHESPKWYVALVAEHAYAHTLDGYTTYGPWRSAGKAQAFCAQIPAPAYRCEVVPVLTEREWLRKGAR